MDESKRQSTEKAWKFKFFSVEYIPLQSNSPIAIRDYSVRGQDRIEVPANQIIKGVNSLSSAGEKFQGQVDYIGVFLSA